MAHVADVRVERGRWRAQRTRPRAVPFTELVHVHALWRDALEGRRDRLAELDRDYHATRTRFEGTYGKIVAEFWCSRVPSAVCLTSQPRLAGKNKVSFHRTSDWATEGLPEIAAQLHRCDRLAARAAQVLTGVRRGICLRLVMSTASHLLSVADAPSEKEAESPLEREKESLDEAERYYRDAATGQAQVVYFVGMALSTIVLLGLVVVGGFFVHLRQIDDRELYGCFAAGAIGAVVSVLQRINSGRFELEYDVGRAYVTFLGALRPVIGAVFGLTIYFAITSRILKLFELPGPGTTSRLYELLVIAFLAGFSERWAQDTLTSLAVAGNSPDKPGGRSAPETEPEPS